MTVYNWPADLAPRGVSFVGRGRTVMGAATLSGQSQVASYDAGSWVARLSTVNAGGTANVKAYRALLAKLEGGAHQVAVPVFDLANAPWPNPGGAAGNLVADQPWDDSFYFDDGFGWAEPAIEVTLSAAASARATNISVTKTTIGTVRGGEYFSIADHLHILLNEEDDGTWHIWPPLREDVALGVALNFDRPVCRMRLAEESSGDLALERGIFGFPDLEFVEVF